MKKFLLDTNAYGAFCQGEEKVFAAIYEADVIFMSSIVLGELYVGFYNGNQREKNMAELRQFLDKPIVEPASITNDTAEVYAILYLALKKNGTPIPLNDVWIASQCLELGAVLITNDHHFQGVTGLRIY